MEWLIVILLIILHIWDTKNMKIINGNIKENSKKIESWFNIIAPKEKTIATLRKELELLASKKWWEIYS